VKNPVEKTVRKIVVGALLLVALLSLKIYSAAAKKSPSQVWSPGCVAAVPKSWGQFRGGSSQTGLAFEDGAGTLRFLTDIPCNGTPVVRLEIRRVADNPQSSGN